MGLETPISILLGDILGLGTHSECRQVSVMARWPRRTCLREPYLRSRDIIIPLRDWFRNCELKDAGNVAPFYLLNGTTLLEDVKAGQPITKDVVDLSGSLPYKLYNEGLKL